MMKSTARGMALVFLLASTSFGDDEKAKDSKPTKAWKAEDLASKMERMRGDYQDLMAACWGKGYYRYDGPEGPVWQLTDAPDPESCDEAEALKDDYRDAYKELLKLDRARVLFDDIPKYVDRR